MNERLAEGQVIERYVVEGQLGSGGMATVWLLRHRHLGTQHALKVLTNIGASAELRLMLEGRVQAALRHPNVVAVTDILDVSGSPGLLMEYVPPPSLAVWLGMHQPTLEEAESLFRGIVDGVRHAHRYGLVHRDLKPSNVLLARYEGEGLVPKVADFGLAKVLTEDAAAGQTRSGLTMGTPQYMAPEQIRDAKKVDRRADMFSLGCILYELLAGRPPYAWTDFITLYNQLQARDYPALPSFVPSRLMDAVNGLLDPERDTRIADCDTLLAVLDGRGMPASPTVSPENLARMVDVPVLRDRIGPPIRQAPWEPVPGSPGRDPSTFNADPASMVVLGRVLSPPTLAADPTLLGATPIGASPRPVPMPVVQNAPPTMVPSDSQDGETSLFAPPAAVATGTPRALVAVAALGALALAGGLGWRLANGGGTIPAPEPLVAVTPPTPSEPVPPGGTSQAQESTVVDPPAVLPESPKLTMPNPGAGHPRAQETPELPVRLPAREPDPVAPPAIRPEPPAPAPEAPVVTTARVRLNGDGDASRVELVGEAGRFSVPGEVPVGSYDVYAWFTDSPQTKTGRVTLAAGDSVSLLCLSFSMSCKR